MVLDELDEMVSRNDVCYSVLADHRVPDLARDQVADSDAVHSPPVDGILRRPLALVEVVQQVFSKDVVTLRFLQH
jgi:hypothetical protein